MRLGPQAGWQGFGDATHKTRAQDRCSRCCRRHPAARGAALGVSSAAHVPWSRELPVRRVVWFVLGGERDMEGPPGVREPHHEHPQLDPGPGDRRVEAPKSTSASAPGGCVCGTATSTRSRPSSSLRRATSRETVTSASVAPCSATNRCQTRRAICRCFPGTSRSATCQPSTMSTYGSIAGCARCGRLRGGGTALANACRTVRRCTRCRSANSRNRRRRRRSSSSGIVGTRGGYLATSWRI